MRNKILISFMSLLVMACSAGAADKMVDSKQAGALELYSAAPAVFIENVGQISDSVVLYVSAEVAPTSYILPKGLFFSCSSGRKPVMIQCPIRSLSYKC